MTGPAFRGSHDNESVQFMGLCFMLGYTNMCINIRHKISLCFNSGNFRRLLISSGHGKFVKTSLINCFFFFKGGGHIKRLESQFNNNEIKGTQRYTNILLYTIYTLQVKKKKIQY